MARGWPARGRCAAPASMPGTIAPNSPFLVPGYGAQGGSAADALSGFRLTSQGVEGGLINASRSVLFPKDADSLANSAWEASIDAAIKAAQDDLAKAAEAL